jgi:hypothetical protein
MLDFAKSFLTTSALMLLAAMMFLPSMFEGAFAQPLPSDLSAAFTSMLIMSLPVLALIALFATANDY